MRDYEPLREAPTVVAGEGEACSLPEVGVAFDLSVGLAECCVGETGGHSVVLGRQVEIVLCWGDRGRQPAMLADRRYRRRGRRLLCALLLVRC